MNMNYYPRGIIDLEYGYPKIQEQSGFKHMHEELEDGNQNS